jgi:xanthine/uracil permease
MNGTITLEGFDMADMRTREKIKTAMDAVTSGERVPERSKKWGMFVFIALIVIASVTLFALAISLWVNQYPMGAGIVIGIALLLLFMAYKIFTADELPKL